MKTTFYDIAYSVLAAMALPAMVAGCQWSPERDNPFDPLSTGYREPPVRNRAPVIDDFYILSHCTNSPAGDLCEFEAICAASDSDQNINPDSVSLFVEDEFYERMIYDPIHQRYTLRDRPGGSLRDWRQRVFSVVVKDDSGAAVADTTIFQDWFQHYPLLRDPPSGTSVPTPRTLDDDTVFSWESWASGGGDFFEINYFFRGVAYEFDTAGISIADTFATIHYDWLSAEHNPLNFYTWELTVHDNGGNTATSLPGSFYYFPPPDTLDTEETSAFIRRED